jgi:co-chaperonin GroES (HSP10)
MADSVFCCVRIYGIFGLNSKRQLMSIKMTSSELAAITLIPNRVLVKINSTKDEMDLGEGMRFKIDKQFSEEKHAPTTGHIYNICGDLIEDKMPWHTRNVLKKGDFVVFTYEAAIYCLDPLKGRHIYDEENNQYLMIDYEDILSARRGGEIIGVNGFMLVEPITEQMISELKLPIQKSVRYGRVAITAERNECYYAAGVKRTDVYDIHEEIKTGDIILFSKFSDIPLEYEVHRSIDGQKQYYRMQRRDILDIVNPDEITTAKISVVC